MAEMSSGANELRRIVEAIRRGAFSEADASRLYREGEDAVKFVLLALAAAAISPHAPSSAPPPYEKPSPAKKQSIGAPLRMVLYGECHIGGYDFDQKCFAVHAELPLHHENRLPIYDLDRTDTSAPSLTAPVSLRTPNRWVMTPEEAERFVATLPPVRPGYNSRTLHLAVEVDLPDAPLARAVLDDGPDGPAYVHGFGLYVRANKATLFKDPLLNSRFAELPIDVSPTPTLAGGALDPPRPNDPPLLDDDLTWVGLMLREKATPSPSDWARAALERLSQDNTFYEKGRPSHLLDARRDQRRFNDDYDSNNRLRINVPLNKIRGGFYEPGYQPFFPEGFDPTHDSPSPLTDEQNRLLGKSAVSRLGNGRMVLTATASRSASDNAYDVEPNRAGAISSRDSQVWEAIGEDPAAVTAWDLRDPDDLLEADSNLTRLVVVLPFGPRELRLSGPEWDERVASFAERRVDLDFDVRLQLQFGKLRVVPSRDEEGRPLQIALLYADPVDLSVLAPEDHFVNSTERTVIATLPITRAAPVEAGPPILAGPPDDAASVAAVGVATAEPKPSAPPLPQEDVVETAVAQAREVTPAAGEQASPPTSPTTSLTPPALSPHWESLLAALAKIPPAEGALVGTGAFAAIVLLGGVWKLLRHRSRETEAPPAAVSATLDQLSRVNLPRAFHALGQKAYERQIGKTELPEYFNEIDRLRARLRSALGENAKALRRAVSAAIVRLGAAVAANTSIAGRSTLAEELRVAEELQRVIAESQGLVAAPSGR